MEVTQAIADRARRWGACCVPDVGTPIESVAVWDLIWVDERQLLLPSEVAALTSPSSVISGTLPVWCRSESESGDGLGSGDGYGLGYGFGDGYGSGSGYGYGSVWGYGLGYGDGSGRGYGSVDGDGYGDGDGSVDGDGYGDGDG